MKYSGLGFFYFLIIFGSPLYVFGQGGYVTLSGMIVDKTTNEALTGATVFIKSLEKGTSTDPDGRFSISGLPSQKIHTRFSYVGYQTVDTTIDIKGDLYVLIELEEERIQLENVYVIAGRDLLAESVRSISILESEALDKNRGQTLGDMIKSLPGVSVLSTGPGVSKPVIRGLHSQRLVLMNHGLVQEGQQWGGEHAPEIDPFSPDRIEIVRGAAGVEYGVGAIGGVIRIDSREINKKKSLLGEVMLNGFSNNAQGSGSVRMEGGIGDSERLGWRSQLSYRNAADSRTPRDVMRNSGFRELSYSFNLNYEQDLFEHDIYFSHFGTELGIFRGAHIGNVSDLERAIRLGRPTVDFEFGRSIENPRQEIDHNLFRYEGNYRIEEVGRLELQLGWQQNRRKEFDAHRRFSNDPSVLDQPAFDLELTTLSSGLKFSHAPVLNGLTGSIGITGMRQGNVRQTSGTLIPNFESYSTGLFIIENWSNGVLTAEAGARFDKHWREVFLVENRTVREQSFNYNNGTFVAGVTYQFASDWSLSGNIGTAWRPPGVNEQFSDGIHHGTAQFELGNEGLESERSFNTDITLRYVSDKTYFQFSVYNNSINDYIFLQPGNEPVLTIRGSFPFFSYQQTDAVIRGMDGTIEHQWFDRLKTTATVSFLRGWDRDAGTPLIFMPSDRLLLSAYLDLPQTGALKSNYLEIKGTLVREQTHFPKGVDFAPPPPGYRLLDLEAGTKVNLSGKQMNFGLALNNVLDATYRDYLSRFRYFIDEPGRNLVLRAKLEF